MEARVFSGAITEIDDELYGFRAELVRSSSTVSFHAYYGVVVR